MSATISFVSDVIDYLKEVPKGPIQNLVNRETALRDWLTASKIKLLGGRGVFTPFVVELTGNADWVGQGSSVVPGKTGVNVRYNIQGSILNGTTSWTVLSEEYSEGTVRAFAEVMEKNMSELEMVLALKLDETAYTGGYIKGLVNTRADFVATASTDDYAGVIATPSKAGTAVVDYNGSYAPFRACDPTDTTTWVHIDIIRLDNRLKPEALSNPGAKYGYTKNAAGGLLIGDATVTAYVKSINEDAGQITIAIVDNTALGGAYLDLTATALSATLPGFAFAIGLAAQVTSPYTFGTAFDFSLQVSGILTNLFSDVQFQVPRYNDSATVPPLGSKNTILQSWGLSLITTTTQPRATPDTFKANAKRRFAKMLDVVQSATNKTLENYVWLTKTTQRSEFAGLLQDTNNSGQTTVYNLNGPDNKNLPQDPGVKFGAMGTVKKSSNFLSNGVPIQFSVNVPEGLWFLLMQESWQFMTTEDGGNWVPNSSGGPLHMQVDGSTGLVKTVYYSTWLMTCQIVNNNPQANGVICGTPLTTLV